MRRKHLFDIQKNSYSVSTDSGRNPNGVLNREGRKEVFYNMEGK